MSENIINSIALLFGRIKRGDKEALVQLFETVDQYIYGIAISILKDHGLAEDVLLETFEAFVFNINKINKHEVVFDWLKVTARNKALNILRKRKKELTLDDASIEYSINRNNKIKATSDVKLIMNEALAQLSENERLVLLYKVHKYTYEEISGLMNMSVGKIRRLIDKAQCKLKNLLK